MDKYAVLCPVCKKQFDTYEGEIGGMGPAMVLGDSRRDHGKESPQCKCHDDWYKGWILEPIPETKEIIGSKQ